MNIHAFITQVAKSVSAYPIITFSQKGRIYTCVNPFSYHMVRNNYKLFSSIDGLFVDGIFMCLLIKILWGEKVPRLSFDMTAIASDLFEFLNENINSSIYFIGAKQEEIEASVKQIHMTYPNIKILGFRNGYFTSAVERNKEIDNILNINPDFIIVGMGSPIQEQFIVDLKNSGYEGIAFTCGGFLHQTSSSIKYYPDWINRLNLRAFYRLFHEKGMVKRLYNVLVEFPILFTYDSLKEKWLNRHIKYYD